MKIGFILPQGEDPDTGKIASYSELRELALQAEEAGFDSVWVYDHLLYRFPDRPVFGIWEGWTLFSALSEATSRVQLGQLVMCALWRNPALIAKMAVTADEISGGRTILGLGAGWHEPEFDAFGFSFDHRAGRFEEAIRIIHPLLRKGVVDFEGKYFSAPICEMRPRGPRPGQPPILIASRGERMLRITAQYADLWNTAWFGRPTLFKERHARLLAACQEVGRDPVSLDVTAGVVVAYPDLDPTSMPENVNDPDRFITGSPEEIASVFREYEALGVGHLICIAMPHTTTGLTELTKALRAYRK